MRGFTFRELMGFSEQRASQASYSRLDAPSLLSTLDKLGERIRDRFPDSGLSHVCDELLQEGQRITSSLYRLEHPIWPVRILVILAFVAILAIFGAALFLALQLQSDVSGLTDLVQTTESAVNDLIFLAIAVFFLFTVESRLKRRLALSNIHRLRSIAHVVDMHQLTKDPVILLGKGPTTAASPERRQISAFQMSRYLDYCTELLAITSKLGALHAQYLNDPVVLEAVNDLESLTDGLSNRIWQKIMMLNREARSTPGSARAPFRRGNPHCRTTDRTAIPSVVNTCS